LAHCFKSPHSTMRAVRWILLLLNVGLIGGLFALGVSDGEPWPAIILLAVTLASLALFILGAGHKDLCRPIRRPRLLMPVAAASLMLAGLVGGLTMAFGELFRFRDGDTEGGEWLIWGTLLATWIFWGVLLYVYTRNMQRYHAIFQLARLVFAGSVAEMLAAVPSHLIVSRRPGCLVGLATAIGILSGLYVMIWSFGPLGRMAAVGDPRAARRRPGTSAVEGCASARTAALTSPQSPATVRSSGRDR
jgi:hypothetical protein